MNLTVEDMIDLEHTRYLYLMDERGKKMLLNDAVGTEIYQVAMFEAQAREEILKAKLNYK